MSRAKGTIDPRLLDVAIRYARVVMIWETEQLYNPPSDPILGEAQFYTQAIAKANRNLVEIAQIIAEEKYNEAVREAFNE